jgi:hypothetical protein
VYENRVLKIFGPEWEVVTGDGKIVYCGGLLMCFIKYYSGDQINNEMGGACRM